MAQAVTADFLLQNPPAGWTVVGKQILRQIDPAAPPDIQLEGYEWLDINALGVGGTQGSLTGAVQKFRQQVQLLGSDLYATALIKKTEVNINFFGIQFGRVDRYRLILCHSAAWIVGFIFILALALAAVILAQYVTMGQSPLLSTLGQMWNGIVKQAVSPIGPAIGGTLVPVFLIVGGLLLAYGVAAKELGVSGTKPPHSRVGLKAGPASTEFGT